MAVSEADGDSTAFFRAAPDPNNPGRPRVGQRAFSEMSDYDLLCFVAEADRWKDGKTPEGFDRLNSWGGHQVARELAMLNATNARNELRRRHPSRHSA